MKNVWNRYRSLALSHILVKAMIVLIIAFAVALPFIAQIYCDTLVAETAQHIKIPLIISLYFATVPVFFAVIALDKMLSNIKKDIVPLLKCFHNRSLSRTRNTIQKNNSPFFHILPSL